MGPVARSINDQLAELPVVRGHTHDVKGLGWLRLAVGIWRFGEQDAR